MAEDLYATLGVARDATAAQIRAAYRKLAKKHHPDLNPGNKAAEERFKAIAAAQEILSDADKRARYDRGEIDASGAPRQPPPYAEQAAGPAGRKYRHAPEPDFGNIFDEIFGGGGGGGGGPRRGGDQVYALSVGFLDAVLGTTQRITLPGGIDLDLRIPPGSEDGQVLRVAGKGQPGHDGAPPGDALIEIAVQPHPYYRRAGDDIEIDVPVTLDEAVLGGRIMAPTPAGPVNLTVPPHSDTGARLRLRGRGVPAHAGRPAGDLYVILRVVLNPNDSALAAFLRGRAPDPAFNPRHHLMERS